MFHTISAPWFAMALAAGMMACLEAGRRLRIRRSKDDDRGSESVGPVEGAVFGLFGLLLAFSFSGAAARYDIRRALVAEESNRIGTAYLRLDLLPAEAQPAMRDLFRSYLDGRLEVYRKLPDVAAARQALERSGQMQSVIWKQSLQASSGSGGHPDAARLLLPAVNEMIDITTTRTMAAVTHPPLELPWLMFALGLGSSLFAGYAMGGSRRRNWLHIAGFVAVTAITVFVILDLEYPRAGFIRLDAYDQFLVEVRNGMK